MNYAINRHTEVPTECLSCSQLGCIGKKDPAEEWGMVHVFRGSSKDRNRAAAGLALEESVKGKKVLIFPFVKRKEEEYDKMAEWIPGWTIRAPIPFKRFAFMMDEEEKIEARTRYEETVTELMEQAKSYDMLILPDVLYAVETGLMGEDFLLKKLKSRPPKLDVVLTGKMATEKILAVAEYVTGIEQIRHPKYSF